MQGPTSPRTSAGFCVAARLKANRCMNEAFAVGTASRFRKARTLLTIGGAHVRCTAGIRALHRRSARRMGGRARRWTPYGKGQAVGRSVRDGSERQGAFGTMAFDRRPQEPAAL